MPTRIMLTIEYDGLEFHGWQTQESGPIKTASGSIRTVQGEIETALKKLTQHDIRIAGASRTDVGVHAAGQTATLDWPDDLNIPIEKLTRALNAYLPIDVVILDAVHVDSEFHAQHCAKGKIYRYKILSRAIKSPRNRNSHWVYRFPLDVPNMQRAAEYLVGTQDLSAFATELDTIQARRAEAGMRPLKTIRTLNRVTVKSIPEDLDIPIEQAGHEVIIEVEGQGFLYKMVRTIVGTLTEVGRGKQSPDWIKEVLESKDRKEAGPTAPARGLSLMKVMY